MNTTAIKAYEAEGRKFITKVYAWMFFAMLLSAAAAFLTYAFIGSSVTVKKIMFPVGFYVLIGVELVLVFVLSLAIRKLPVGVAALFFILYSIIDGMTLSTIFFNYAPDSIILAFITSALLFLVMTIYGAITKRNMNSFGRYLFMFVTGIIIASLINLFFRSSVMNWIISLVSVAVFTGLTAYDTHKIVRAAEYYNGSDAFKKAAIISALELYLDFINIFLSLLRLFGRNKD